MTRSAHFRRPLLITIVLASLACACLASSQDSARTLLERGAFAEEHERDFVLAADLYAQAGAAARASKDSATADLADAARSRVLARQGQIVAANSQAQSEPPAQAMRLLAEGSELDPKSERGQAVIADLAIAGASVVPWLESMFNAQYSFALGTWAVKPNPIFAVHALAKNASPEAQAALLRCFKTPDPLVRHAIVRAVLPWRDVQLVRLALADPVPSVSDEAVEQAERYADVSFTETMEAPARRGNSKAQAWLAKNAGERVLALAEDVSTPFAVRESLLNMLSDNGRLPAQLEFAERLLAIGREPSQSQLRQAAHEALRGIMLHNNGGWTPQLDRLREPVGKLVVAELQRDPTPTLIYVLANLSPDDAPQEILALIKRLQTTADDKLVKAFSYIENLRPDASGKSFDAWVEIARITPSSWVTSNGKPLLGVAMDRIRDLAISAPLDALARGARNLPSELLKQYSRAIETRLNNEFQRAKGESSGLQPGSLDRATLPVALALLEIDRKRYAGTAANILAAIGDVEQLPLALDLFCEPNSRHASSVRESVRTLIQRAPERGKQMLDERIAKLASLPKAKAESPEELRKLGYVQVSAGNEPIDPKLVLEAIAFLPGDRALASFRTWYPKLANDECKQALLRILIQNIEGPDATVEIARHYNEIAPYMRAEAIERFGDELYEPAVPLLGEALRDTDGVVRSAAHSASLAFRSHRQALEEFDAWTHSSKAAQDSVAELTRLLESANRDVVLGAVEALAAVKAKTALPALVKLLEKNDPDLKKAVQNAIARIGD